jgi:hypothetical protein
MYLLFTKIFWRYELYFLARKTIYLYLKYIVPLITILTFVYSFVQTIEIHKTWLVTRTPICVPYLVEHNNILNGIDIVVHFGVQFMYMFVITFVLCQGWLISWWVLYGFRRLTRV